METEYIIDRHMQMLIELLKFHGIKKIVSGPSTISTTFLQSLKNDSYFEIFPSNNEILTAYIACGIAEEKGEQVAVTYMDSSVNQGYIEGIREAYYKNISILVITLTQSSDYKTCCANDVSGLLSNVTKESITVRSIYTEEDAWACGVAINKAIIAMKKNGGGPAHINLKIACDETPQMDGTPRIKGIEFIGFNDEMPTLDSYPQIAILVGNHNKWSNRLTESVDRFCELYNAVVLKYHACNYKGKYGVNHAVILNMRGYETDLKLCKLVIYIGSIPRYHSGLDKKNCEMWRVNPDGIIRDPEEILTKVFAMEEEEFFKYYVEQKEKNGLPDKSNNNLYAKAWQVEYARVIAKTPDLPLSNVWIAKNTINRIPDGSVLHMAGSNTARAWNFFELPSTVECYSNDGAMGIDGQVSALIGESLADPKRLHFGVVGDLTFFYDMNSIGNRHVGANLRLLVVNNGLGAEFRIYSNPAYQFGEDGRSFMAAAGHFGNKSPNLLRHYAEDLGFEYLSAYSKEEFLNKIERFLTPDPVDKPMIFEVFTCEEDESKAIYDMNHMAQSTKVVAKELLKGAIKSVAGEKGTAVLKKMLKR